MIAVDDIRAWVVAEQARAHARYYHDTAQPQHCSDIAWGRMEMAEEIIAMIDAARTQAVSS